jgi:phage tail tape-measure protein
VPCPNPIGTVIAGNPLGGDKPVAVVVVRGRSVEVGCSTTNRPSRPVDRIHTFEHHPSQAQASVRQFAGRTGEVWGAESGADKLFVLKAE